MPEPQPVFYRLYHDDQGCPLFYSMQDLPGTYIDITPEQYASSKMTVRVRDGELVPITWQTAQKLTPSDSGTLCHSQDVAVIVDQNGIYWRKKIYES